MTHTIEVTKEHIKNSKLGVCTRCAIALAMSDAGFQNVVVHGNKDGYARWTWNKKAKLPRKAILFIYNHDRGNKVKPFSFTLTEE